VGSRAQAVGGAAAALLPCEQCYVSYMHLPLSASVHCLVALCTQASTLQHPELDCVPLVPCSPQGLTQVWAFPVLGALCAPQHVGQLACSCHSVRRACVVGKVRRVGKGGGAQWQQGRACP
jgi:hypothetical protein